MHKDPVSMHIINVISQQFFGCRPRKATAAHQTPKPTTSFSRVFFFFFYFSSSFSSACDGIGGWRWWGLVRMVMATVARTHRVSSSSQGTQPCARQAKKWNTRASSGGTASELWGDREQEGDSDYFVKWCSKATAHGGEREIRSGVSQRAPPPFPYAICLH